MKALHETIVSSVTPEARMLFFASHRDIGYDFLSHFELPSKITSELIVAVRKPHMKDETEERENPPLGS